MFSEKQPAQRLEEQNHREKGEEMRKRIDGLRETDNRYTDSVFEIAQSEGDFREKLKEAGISKKDIDLLADIYSTKDLQKIEAEKQKWVDDLTGLRNRMAYNQEVPQLLNLEKRENNYSSLLVVDIDYFKKVNDQLGHITGDAILKEVAEILKDSVRSSDIVYRYGGEEFVVFLPDTISAVAYKIAEKIRSAVERHNIEVSTQNEGKMEIKKTISVGCFGTDQNVELWNKQTDKKMKNFLEKIMFKKADEALLNSKKTGRNKVTLSGSETNNFIQNKEK